MVFDARDILHAARAVVIESFDTVDYSLPHGFKILYRGSSVVISGPESHRNDDAMIEGIMISFYREFCRVRFKLQSMDVFHEQYEYAVPIFPDNMMASISNNIATWMCYWDAMKDDGGERIQRIIELYGR